MGKRPKILCLTSNFPRWEGDSTTPFIHHLAQDLQAIGYRVDVLAPHALGCATSEVIEGVRVERFRYSWPQKLQTLCYQGGTLINLRKNRLNYANLPGFVLAETAAVRHRLSTGAYDLLHSHWVLPQGFVGTLATLSRQVPHVITVHGGDVFGLKGGFLSGFKRFAFNHADAVTVNSSATRKAVEDIAPIRKAIHCIPMGVTAFSTHSPPSRVAELRKRFRRGQGPMLVFVGRVVSEKGVEDFIRAVSNLQGTCPEVTGLIVGEGQDRFYMERLAGEMGVSDRIFFTGWIDPGEVRLFLSAGDIFVGPSRIAKEGWTEGQGLVFLEAMAAKIPVIATNVGGIPDIVVDEKTGLLVNERSPEEIALAVKRLIMNPSLCDEIIARGYRLVLNGYSRDSSAKAFSNLFEHVIQKVSCHSNHTTSFQR